jgi:hypothetical protein
MYALIKRNQLLEQFDIGVATDEPGTGRFQASSYDRKSHAKAGLGAKGLQNGKALI